MWIILDIYHSLTAVRPVSCTLVENSSMKTRARKKYSTVTTVYILSSKNTYRPMRAHVVSQFITCRAKLLNADWLRQRAFFLNQEGTVKQRSAGRGHDYLMLIG